MAVVKSQVTNANHGNEPREGEWNESEIGISHCVLSRISISHPWVFFTRATTDKVSHHPL
jgi:hypothetical protein